MQTLLLVTSTICPVVLLIVLVLAFRPLRPKKSPAPHWSRVEYLALLRRYKNLKRNFRAHGYKLQVGTEDREDVMLYILREQRLRPQGDLEYLDRLLNLMDRLLLEVPRVSYYDPKVDRQLGKIRGELLRHYEALRLRQPRKFRASVRRLDRLSDWKH